ncbi:YihY/virulence factor BrkB family protein [Bauldia litoralis]|uniref:YihY/virulence factor BrkB family protein n=1 Tax=Bauldia litoralis TaxID=665467 RepID=UPI001586FC48|nr:YihY/virulence factor BrkB family protein [Bauldia litoralis]
MIGDAVGHLTVDDGFAMASHVALSALMSVFPFLIFVAALAGFIGEADLAGRVAGLLFETWPQDVAEPIARDVSDVLTRQQSGLLTISVLVTIFLASNGVEAVRTALNRAYRVTDKRNYFLLRLQSVVFVIGGAFASLAVAFLGLLGPLLFDWLSTHFPAIEPYATTFDLVRFAVTGVMLALVLIGAHLWLPAGRPPALRLWPGIVITLALWLIATWAFGFYLQRFANYAAYYAGLASVVTAIFFMYLVALIMIFGAELNASLARTDRPRS